MTEATPVPIAGASAAPQAAARRRARWKLGGGLFGLAVLGVAGTLLVAGNGAKPDPAAAGETATAVREKLVVTITESGEVDAKKSTDVRCEVEGQSFIVWVIEEGTLVKKGDKLVELDAADLQEKLQTQDMAYKTAKAAFDKADQAYLISKSLRESALSAAQLKARFALLDLKKSLGTDLADRLIKADGAIAADVLLKDKALGGSALQQLRKLQTDIDLANQKLSRAKDKLEWTEKLKEKGYVTGSELEADRLDCRSQEVLLDQAKTELELFVEYAFQKSIEQAYTDWLEAKRECDRIDARTKSDMEAAKATRDVSEQGLVLEDIHLKKAKDQVAKCTISAPQQGLVVYDTSGNRWNQNFVLEPGATVRNQQTLLKLPDMTEMHVKAKLHESVVKQVSEKAPAYVTIDAFPGDRLTGTVTKIAIMPDRGNFWLNPGLKSYITEVTLDKTPPNLKPGMSAQVEILVDSRDRVLQVPASAVYVDKGFQVAYVKTPLGAVETRRVEVGLSNDKRIEITKGLEENEVVYLFKPPGAQELKVSEEEMKKSLEAKEPPKPKENGWHPAVKPEMGGDHADAAEPAKPAEAAAAKGPEFKFAGQENLAPEKLKALREKFEKLSPDERQEFLKRIAENAANKDKDKEKGPTADAPADSKDRRP